MGSAPGGKRQQGTDRVRRSNIVSLTRRNTSHRDTALLQMALLAATGLIVLTCVSGAALAQSGSGNDAITVNRDVIQSLGDSNGSVRDTNVRTRPQTTPWGTPLPGSPFARLPAREYGGNSSVAGEQGLAFPPRDMPRSTLMIGDGKDAQPTSTHRTSRSSTDRQPSATSALRTSRQAERTRAPSEPARGKPRSVLGDEEPEEQEQIATQRDADPEPQSQESTPQIEPSAKEGPELSAEPRQKESDTEAKSDSGTSQPETAASPEPSDGEGREMASTDSAVTEPAQPQQSEDAEDGTATPETTTSPSSQTGQTAETDTSERESEAPSEKTAEDTGEAAGDAEETSVAAPQSSADQQAASDTARESDTDAETEETRQAALPDSAESGDIAETTITFSSESADLSSEAKQQLRELAAHLSQNASARIQLLAYAEGSDEDASQARRLSLSRALAVRAYLLDHGIRSTRIDVRALGHDAPGSGPTDRVNIVPEDPEDS